VRGLPGGLRRGCWGAARGLLLLLLGRFWGAAGGGGCWGAAGGGWPWGCLLYVCCCA
jgi:hypothetical protein